MMVLVGFALGYVLGAQAGREGLTRLVVSWQAIQKSDEFAGLVEAARSMAGAGLRQAVEVGTGQLNDVVNRRLRVA